ncbi:MAG: hypothetical protein M3Y27_22455 [Acidobacteriota bacterium]|nr:hypothetical protein [Acidobacteriota bacterium]
MVKTLVPAAAETDSLLEQLKALNERLLALSVPIPDAVPDLSAIAEAIERRGQLITRVGHLLRDSGVSNSPGALTSTAYRAALDQALDAGESAVQRILSLRQAICSNYVQLNRMRPETQATSPLMSYEM